MPLLVGMSDFFLALGGLALLVVSATSLAFRRLRPGGPAWSLAVAGSLALGLSMWVGWVELMVASRPPALVVVRIILEAAAWVLLAWFGLSSLARDDERLGRHWSWLKYCVFAPLPVALLGILGGLAGLEMTVRYVLGLTTVIAILAAAAVWSRRRPAGRPAAGLLVLGLGILGIGFLLGVPPSDLWPATFLNAHAVGTTTGLPPAMLQAVGACLLAVIVVERLLRVRRHEAEQSAEAVPPSRLAAWVVPVLAGLILIGCLLARGAGWIWERDAQANLLQRVSTAGVALEGAVARVVGRDVISEQDPAYVDLKARLVEMAAANRDLRFVWVARLVDGRVELVGDSEDPASPDYSHPGQAYDEAADVIRQGLLVGGGPAVVGPVSDRWGSWFSGIYSIVPPGSALPPTIIGMDVPTTVWYAELTSSRVGPVGMTILLLALALGYAVSRYQAQELQAGMAASERRYRSLVEGSPACVLMLDRTASIVALNETGRGMLGLKAEEEGLRFLDLWPSASQPDVLAALETVMLGERAQFEAEYVAPDGREMILFVVLNPVLRGPLAARRYVGFALDVTERRRADQELLLTQYAVDNAGIGVFRLDLLGRFQYANTAVAELCGYSREKLTTMAIPDVDPSVDGERLNVLLSGLQTDGRAIVETEIVRPGGERVPAQITLSLVGFAGGKHVYAFVEDLRERRAAEEERAKLEEQIRHSQKLESLGVLAGGIAHDFNNLLVGILGHAELGLLEVERSSPVAASLRKIEAAAHHAAALTNQMLAYSGRGRFQVRLVDLSSLVGEIAKLLDVSIPKKVTLVRRLPDGLPGVHADVAQVQQVVLNLITNAAEAIGEEQGVIEIRTGSTTVDHAQLEALLGGEQMTSGEYVYLEVEDNGCGMDEKTRERIFEPFYTTKFTGRGLGLAAVLGIVRGHRGSIHVDSTPGTGTKVRVLFPAVTQDAEVPTGAELPPPTQSAAGGMVLVADDERSVREVCRRILERAGFTVVTASDGVEAVELFRTSAQEIAVVLLDLTMPRMDGAEALVQMLKIDPGARVIVTSGYSEDELAERIPAGSAVGFVQKPFRRSALVEAILQALPDDGPSSLQQTASVN